MAEVIYPSEFELRVLAQEAPGGAPARVAVVIPTVTTPDKPFDIRVAVLDANGYPSLSCDGTVKIKSLLASPLHYEIPFESGTPAVGLIRGAVLTQPRLERFHVELAGAVSYSNPTCCTRDARDAIYWGDPHVHTVLSDCHANTCRSLNFCFTAARWLTCLDWVSAADHVSNGRCGLGKWREQSLGSNLYNDPPLFATLPGYEASLKGMSGGDTNVYMSRFPDLFVDEYEEGNVTTLCEKLAAKLGDDEFFVVPHHTTRTGKHGEIPDEIYPGAERMPVVEIHSKWGTSEYRGNPNALHEIHPGPSYAADLLARGLQLGFIAGTDTHATMPSGAGEEPGHIDRLPGLTAVGAPELSREGIFEGIRNRTCYATSLERIYLDAHLSGTRFGRTVEWADASAPRRIDVVAAARSHIEFVELIRNGESICSQPGEEWQAAFAHCDENDLSAHWLESRYLGRFVYYYVRVTCQSGAQAWSSPLWLIAK